jgi:predicted metal-dependent phosphoesterase TrpH
MKFDLHIHTARHSPDSAIDPFALVRRAKEVGLDGIVITEHDFLWTEAELKELRAAQPDLVILAGVEVSAHSGHVLVYGVTDPFKLPKNIAWPELCREVHRQGGVAVAAHPYRWGQPFETILRKQKPELDGLELMTKNMDDDMRRRAAAVHKERGWAGLGNSDAHAIGQVGVCYTEFAATIRSDADLVAAIRGRKATARERS